MRPVHRPLSSARIGLALAILLVAGAGCVRFRRQNSIHLSTEPPGAAILLDGEDSGYTTPAWVPLSGGERLLLLRREGFFEETLVLQRGEDVTVVGPRVWIASSTTFSPFPVSLTLQDAVWPFTVDSHPYPRRFHLALLPR